MTNINFNNLQDIKQYINIMTNNININLKKIKKPISDFQNRLCASYFTLLELAEYMTYNINVIDKNDFESLCEVFQIASKIHSDFENKDKKDDVQIQEELIALEQAIDIRKDYLSKTYGYIPTVDSIIDKKQRYKIQLNRMLKEIVAYLKKFEEQIAEFRKIEISGNDKKISVVREAFEKVLKSIYILYQDIIHIKESIDDAYDNEDLLEIEQKCIIISDTLSLISAEEKYSSLDEIAAGSKQIEENINKLK